MNRHLTFRIPAVILSALLLVSCYNDKLSSLAESYEKDLYKLRVKIVYSDDPLKSFEGSTVNIEEVNTGAVYKTQCDAFSAATFKVPDGIYRVKAAIVDGDYMYSGLAEKVKFIGGGQSLELPVKQSKAGKLIIKEIYCGGCKCLPLEGTYQYDKYVMIHNNAPETIYLDSLCFGALDPYNAIATNKWVKVDPETGQTIFQTFAPVIQAVWRFQGDGRSFPLESGKDAVIALCGAIDHTVQYPLSVNLNKADYFVTYDETYFPNTAYHPAPGDQIKKDHILKCVIKTGKANAYAYSINSPATVIFRPVGMTIEEFVNNPDNIIQVPGSSVDKVAAVPWEWILDGVEVFTAGSSNTKRIPSTVDAGYVVLSDTFLGHTLMRKVNEDISSATGYEVLFDTNDSSSDFYEREKQSLHD